MSEVIAPANIGQYTIGRVVKHSKSIIGNTNLIGHVIGFEVSDYYKEVIIKVQWCNGETYSIHPGNVELL